MNADQLGAAFRQIAGEVCKATDAKRCWSQILGISGQSSNELLANVNVNADIDAVQKQSAEIFSTSPFPRNLAFFYFGLYEHRNGTGYYISGYEAADAVGTLSRGDEPSFFPANRHLTSLVLKAIDAETATIPTKRDALNYAVTFGAGAMLSRFAMLALQLRQPVYVGFDSGDFARIK